MIPFSDVYEYDDDAHHGGGDENSDEETAHMLRGGEVRRRARARRRRASAGCAGARRARERRELKLAAEGASSPMVVSVARRLVSTRESQSRPDRSEGPTAVVGGHRRVSVAGETQ